MPKDKSCGDCKDCTCGKEEDPVEKGLIEPDDLMEQVESLLAGSGAPRISIDRDNADLYAFSDFDLRSLRRGKDVAADKWDEEIIKDLAQRIVMSATDLDG